MAIRKLGSIYARFYYRTDQIAETFRTPLPSNPQEALICQPLHQAGEVQLVNRLLVLWGEYCRNLVILSSLGGMLTLGNELLAPAPDITGSSRIRLKLGKAFGAGPGTHWDDSDWVYKRIDSLQPENADKIRQGLANAPVENLKAVRNYLIHPNQHTAANYQGLARQFSYISLEPKELLSNRLPGGGTVLESWVVDFQDAAREAAL